ncbi:SubName: Full=Uncharacterized protein {ECO:0000313/EMBL:CCA73139.1} [Serendipita indica DSM 11827]|uniref:Uncharacterized protein n=1 Tax=Serendipita indica (strain DSM 11827) TaxID=1109443 RepID=G4TP96_SERID|nr:SubName: Full=Uncharacterized protein {ECO:0000313/EMBL:CCA73139.1} [Serendipita indica DSM 11827]CCA73139.1 hypothetical protein PIIN_07093 [Serendipita indica DSM 11827]
MADFVMEYDSYDAILHHIFKQTQGEAWFKPTEESMQAGVALRIDNNPPKFRVFPYENMSLVPFEAAVRALNPLVAVKIRSASVHASLAIASSDDTGLYVDKETRIQILDSIADLPTADKEQSAAFIRDERVLICWSDNLDGIIPTCKEFEDKLISLVWKIRTAQLQGGDAMSSATSITGYNNYADSHHTLEPIIINNQGTIEKVDPRKLRNEPTSEFADGMDEKRAKTRSSFFGWRTEKDGGEVEADRPAKRPTRLLAPIYNGLGAALALVLTLDVVRKLLIEFWLDGGTMRFALIAITPLLFCVSLFFYLFVIGVVTQSIGPVAQFHQNSKYYSAVKPAPNPAVDRKLPHITIQMPVYKESLTETIAPSCESLKKAMQTYARQGGTSCIMICDDGMQLIEPAEAAERKQYYADHGIGWIARPRHSSNPDGFKRAGRFKKASNMNYALKISLKLEEHLARFLSDERAVANARMQAQLAKAAEREQGITNGHSAWADEEEEGEESLEELALRAAMDEVYAESGNRFQPWGAGGKALRVGELILIVDSDTIVPEDCLRDAAREMAESPELGVIQHESDVMQVSHNYFENGIAHFTRRINKAISFAAANGEVAAFVGHNAFLRWSAIQDVAFIDPADGERKIWSEANVSEDFDMALRLQLGGYTVRWASYSEGGFKEGVSLTADDELNRWEKYAFGCSELIFNPLIKWFTRGPISGQLHRFVWSNAPVHYKISMMAYMFSYYGIAASFTLSLFNYLLIGWQLPISSMYLQSFQIWVSIVFIFPLCGNIAHTLLEYRIGHKGLLAALWENIIWIPFFFVFFGGLSIHLSKAILAHLFSYNITWGATKKEVERSNFFLEVPKILVRFRVALVVCFITVGGMVVLALPFVPLDWKIPYNNWSVIIPLAISAISHFLYPIVLNPYLMVFSY